MPPLPRHIPETKIIMKNITQLQTLVMFYYIPLLKIGNTARLDFDKTKESAARIADPVQEFASRSLFKRYSDTISVFEYDSTTNSVKRFDDLRGPVGLEFEYNNFQYAQIVKKYMQEKLQQDSDTAQKTSKRVFVLGRERVVRRMGRKSFVLYHKELISLPEARKLDRLSKKH